MKYHLHLLYKDSERDIISYGFDLTPDFIMLYDDKERLTKVVSLKGLVEIDIDEIEEH